MAARHKWEFKGAFRVYTDSCNRRHSIPERICQKCGVRQQAWVKGPCEGRVNDG